MSDNAAGFAALDDMIARVRKLPELVERAAPDIAHALEQELEQQVSRGQDPEGRAWQARQDGGQPLRYAGKSLAVVAVGKTVYARLRGVEARHHLGRARGGIERQILPRKLTPRIAELVRRKLEDAFRLTVGGAP